MQYTKIQSHDQYLCITKICNILKYKVMTNIYALLTYTVY